MKKIWVKRTVSLLLLLSVVGCGQSPVRNPFAGRAEPKLGDLPDVSEAQPVAGIVAWSNSSLSKQQRFSKLQPYVAGEHIFAADHSGKVVALDSESGRMLWKSNTGKKYSAGPYLVGNSLLLTTSDAKVIALEAHTGQLLWEKKVSSEVLAPPAGTQGIIFVHATDGSVIALRAQDGEEIWHVEHSTPTLTLRYSSAPVVAGDKVLVGFATGKMLALNCHSGVIEWERTISLPRGRSEIQRMVDISADPIVVGDSVYVITYQGKLAAVNVTTGDLLWDRDLSSYQNMACDSQHLFVTDNSYNLWAIDRFSGATAWKQTTLSERYITGPAVMGSTVAVADRAGYLHYLSASNGHIVDRQHLSGKIYQSPLSMGNSLLVTTYKGKMSVLRSS